MSTTPNRGPASRDPSTFVLRRILPVTVAITVVTGALRWFATDRGVVADQSGVIVMTSVAILVFSGFAVWSARQLRRLSADQRSADREALYRLTARSIPDAGVFVFDRDLRYLLADGQNFNTAGLRSSDLEGRTIWEALEPDVAARVEPSYRAALRGETETWEMAFRDNVYLVTVAPTRDDDGTVVGGIVHTQQITERKRLEEQLLQSQKLEAIGLLAGGVAHDFNNLLTVISGYATLALARMGGLDPNRKDIEQVSLAAARAAGLTQQLLAFSRRQLLRPRAVDVSEVVDGLTSMLRSLVEERVELVVDTRSGLPAVMFDRGRLEQVIVNLVVNARDAIADAGTIVVETSQTTLDAEYVAAHSGAREGLHVAITVSDTGSGFDETIRERIFEPFFTTKPPGVGTGLGLSTVHGIVAQSGGNIWIYSEPGRGTTFKVYIPVAPGAVAVAEPEALPEQPAPVRGAALLVVEDDEAVRRLTTRILGDAGYEVVSAASTDEARDALRTRSIDLVLSDLVMPGGTGERLAESTDRRGLRPPVIFMSGYTASSVTREELLAAHSRYIEKPFSPASLLSIVADTLNEERSRPLARPA